MMYRHLLIPTDGHPLSMEAITHGVELARKSGAKVTILTVSEPAQVFASGGDQVADTPDEYRRHMRNHAAQGLDAAATVAASAGVSYDKVLIEQDEPYRAIIRVAEERGCDLIVMASHGRRGLPALVLGSETMKVLTHCSVPVLVYRSPAARAAQQTAA
jgi:nucleotide-binding universal stress UspA family protein